MIIYFSGTGNSRFLAKKLSKILEEKLLFIPHTAAESVTLSDENLGIVCPVYSWGIPPIVLDFLARLSEEAFTALQGKKIWAVLSCGDETGKAPEMLDSALKKRGLRLDAGWSVIMPNTYVLLPGFDVDNKKLETQKLDHAADRIRQIATKIECSKWEFDFHYGPWPAVKTGVVYPLFKRWGISARKWRWTQECVSCGKCAEVCPVGNVAMQGGHPKWGSNCTSCLACYHVCPGHAIEYGTATAHKGQYFCHIGRD